MKTQRRNHFMYILGLLVVLLSASFTARAQTVSATITLDTSNKFVPLRFTLIQNTRQDIKCIRISAKAPTKFASFIPEEDSLFSVFPIRENTIEISMDSDEWVFPTGSNIPIARFLTDSSTWVKSKEIIGKS